MPGATFPKQGEEMPTQTFETRNYQLEMLEESLRQNIIIALDTGAGKTHIAILRMKHEMERESRKISWFLAPTVALARQQQEAIAAHLPVSVGLISGTNDPDQWRDRELWCRVLNTHRIVVTTPNVLLNALRHGYVHLGDDIGLLVFDEAHHASGKHPYNCLMREFYDALPPRVPGDVDKTMRPVILGLTASPIFGGDAERAFRQLEFNLDSIICAPLLFREDLKRCVHRPRLKRVIYAEPEYYVESTPPSRNLQSLKSVVDSLDIEEDPYVLNLRAELELQQHKPGPKRDRLDQRLSRAIDGHGSFTHKGLRDFKRAADEICSDLGEWAADWYVHQVCKHATDAGRTSQEFALTMNDNEKEYLLGHLSRIEITPIPDDDPDDILRRSSDKVEKLVDTLLKEKTFFEENQKKRMDYRGIVFVTRRDAVHALTEILARHPRTAQVFTVGSLLGGSGNSRRRSFLDITRRLLRQPQDETLKGFSAGDINLIVATAVAEEGLDIQACCNVVRWDVPPNMVSWAQSRGRARQELSSTVLMLSDTMAFEPIVRKWEELEKQMTRLYDKRSEYQAPLVEDEDADDDDGDLRFRVDATGAVLTGNSAIEHIFHFCSILSYTATSAPQFDIDPPDYPSEWHTNRGPRVPSTGPYGCTLTLPRLMDPRFRSFSTPRIHLSKDSARRHVAFEAYRALYENKLLNGHLLPLTSTLETDGESEVQLLLKEVEKREGMALVSSQMDPWHASGGSEADTPTRWWSTTLEVDGLPPLRMLTQAALPPLKTDELPVIHPRESPPFKVRLVGDQSTIVVGDDDGILARAEEFTRRLFWPMYSSRMKWDQTDFLYLFIPVDESPTVWDERRSLAYDPDSFPSGPRALFSPFPSFMRHDGQIDDIHIVCGTGLTGRAFKFIRLRNTPVTIEEKADLERRRMRRRGDDHDATALEITYPLIEVRPIVKRYFLSPMPDGSKGVDAVSQKTVLLLQDSTLVALISSHEAQYALWAPSIIRHLQLACTVSSMRDTLFIGTPLGQIPLDLLLTAITMPAAHERTHYQRLETLGDTTLKFAVCIQLLSAQPLWHEGYLSRRKDHAVSNANLAKMAIERKLYKWIIRDMFIPRKWKPRRASDLALVFNEAQQPSPDKMTEKQKRRVSVARNLSTKVLADVVEALIGAAYFHGGFAMGIECMKVFDLDLSWKPLPECINVMYSRVIDFPSYPTQIAVVESILGYTFRRKTIAVEALTHASYQSDLETISYERMEFLGDAVLDMLVTDYLYRAPGKDYGPGKIHLIKQAVVNAHFLAMLCLRASTEWPVVMPTWSHDNGVTMTEDRQRLYLYKCLLHSSIHVMDEQQATFTRWERPGGRDEIEAALTEGRAFPWSALTSLQAPKFLSDMFESLLGAVYLDSRGDLDIVRDVLRRLGHWEVLEHIVNHDTAVMNPISRLYLWASKHHEKVKCGSPKRDGKTVSCSVLWDDHEITKVEDEWRGRISNEGVRFAVAEEAIAILEDPVSLLQIWLAMRDRSIDYSMEEAEGMWTCTAIVDGTRIATVQPPLQLGSSEETVTALKRAAAAEAFKKLEEPVHWLAFLSEQHDFEVGYQIYEEEGRKVCCVHVDGYEASRVEDAIKGPGTERDSILMRKAAKEAVEWVELQIATRTEVWVGTDWDEDC